MALKIRFIRPPPLIAFIYLDKYLNISIYYSMQSILSIRLSQTYKTLVSNTIAPALSLFYSRDLKVLYGSGGRQNVPGLKILPLQ